MYDGEKTLFLNQRFESLQRWLYKPKDPYFSFLFYLLIFSKFEDFSPNIPSTRKNKFELKKYNKNLKFNCT